MLVYLKNCNKLLNFELASKLSVLATCQQFRKTHSHTNLWQI